MIRKMTINDIFEVVKLENQVFKESLGEEFFLKELEFNPFQKYYVYELNKTIISYIGLRVYDDQSEVIHFLVKEGYQNKGYGQAVFDYILDELKNNSIKTITLEVRKNNHPALNFYYKNDFNKIGLRKKYYSNNDDAILLMKEV